MVYNEGHRRHRRHVWQRKALCGVSAAAVSASLLAFGPGLVAGASAASGGLSTNTTSYCKSGATPVTFWGWVPGIYRVVDVFNQTHPNICVDYVTKVGGSGEYIPLLNALKAHSGAPDVAEIEFDVLPSFEVLHYTTNLVPYGANKYAKDFVNWAWSEVSNNGAVWAMPDDGGVDGVAVRRHRTGEVRRHQPPQHLVPVRGRRPEGAPGQPEGLLRRLRRRGRPVGAVPHAASRSLAVRVERGQQGDDQLHRQGADGLRQLLAEVDQRGRHRPRQ